ncbi:MAG: hypothetical protein K2X93_04815 [Candidatus Obscuribacterales bacterium]|nr:hypothetical protein [Candidatus Obscuribacterales bacterium]
MFRIIVILFVAAGIAFGGFWYWTTTPQYSIAQIKDAMKTHDRQKFDKHVDVNDFSSGMVDDMLTQPMKECLGGGMVGRWVAGGLSALFKPSLVAGIKQDLYNLVESGTFSQSTGEDQMSLNAMDERLCLRQHSVKSVEKLKSEGKIAEVEIVLHNEKHNKDLKLHVQMRDMGGYWQVTRMLNFPEFTSQLVEMEGDHEKTDSI